VARSVHPVKGYGEPVTSGSSQVRPVRSGNVFEETIEHLLRLLRLGQFPTGSRLPSERALAESLRVSRTTLREALAELQRAGYVDVRRGRYGGSYVADVLPRAKPTRAPAPDPAEVDDVLLLRGVVEPAAARLCAERDLATADRQALLNARLALRAATPEQYRPLDSRLHLLIAELSGSPSLAAVVAEVRSRVNNLLDQIPLLPFNLEHSSRQHDAIVDAILAGDGRAAERAAVAHLDGTAALLRGFLG
jgi:DNA-binding FadR family transcriptional regulator